MSLWQDVLREVASHWDSYLFGVLGVLSAGVVCVRSEHRRR